MNKKISLGIVAILMVAGAVVYAQSNTTNCPDTPGCVCSKEANVKVAKKQAVVEKKANCPNTPNCICD